MNLISLANCLLCGHRCGVNRYQGPGTRCQAGIKPIVSSYCLHHGEEPMISGTRGSGTIFFANCCLKCVYCQNYEISQQGTRDQGPGTRGEEVEAERLAEIMLELQAKGAHNINLVSPTHYALQIADALKLAREQGLKLPVVYNTGGYDSLELLSELEGLIDVYLPDFKYFSEGSAQKYSGAGNYPKIARAGIAEMFRQVGNIKLNDEGVARSGLLVRHLVLPDNLAGTDAVLKWLAALSPEIRISLMAQYSPQHRAAEFPELARRLRPEEYRQAVAEAEKLGLRNVYVQELASSETFLPDFNQADPFAG